MPHANAFNNYQLVHSIYPYLQLLVDLLTITVEHGEIERSKVVVETVSEVEREGEFGERERGRVGEREG